MPSNLSRFNPFNELARLRPMRSLEDFFNDFSLSPNLADYDMEPRIKMDVVESDRCYKVKAEIPGVKKEDIKVDIDGNQVCITAECKSQFQEKEGNTVRSECYYGQKYRSFTLAHDIDNSKAEAHYQDGVLELNLPKKNGGGNVRKLTIN